MPKKIKKTTAQLKADADYLREQRAKWRASADQCSQCGRKGRVPGSLRCKKCFTAGESADARRRLRARRFGICSYCDNEVMPGTLWCGACAERIGENVSAAKQRRATERHAALPAVVYVAGPYTAPSPEGIAANVNRALLAGAKLAALGLLPIVPHVALPPRLSWSEAMRRCQQLLHSVDCIVLLPDWHLSRGARLERAWAEAAGIPVFHFADVCPQEVPHVCCRIA